MLGGMVAASTMDDGSRRANVTAAKMSKQHNLVARAILLPGSVMIIVGFCIRIMGPTSSAALAVGDMTSLLFRKIRHIGARSTV